MKLETDTEMTQVLKQTFFNKRTWMVFILAILTFASALSVIYVKNWHRNLFIQIEQLQSQKEKLHTEWTQLLLEESTWAAGARIEGVATKQLDMKVPTALEMQILTVPNHQ